MGWSLRGQETPGQNADSGASGNGGGRGRFQDQEYQEEETVILHVRADKKNEYFIDEDDMNTLILKILKLDEIGG